jgi:predicted alpha/beta-hydrolase family hydrolase
MRTAHLPAIRLPMLFVHGSRDGFGTPDELRAALAGLAPPPTVHIVTGADHSLTVLKSAATPQAAVAAAVQRAVVEWVALVSQGSPAPGHEALDRAGGRIAVE